MCKKIAEEYAQGMATYYESAHGSIPSQFEKYLRKAVEYGYNKANEWHDLRKDPNDLPKENMKQVMIITNYNDCLMGWYCIHKKTWYSSDCPDPDDYIETEGIMEIKIIKWKEIMFPKE